MSVTHINFPNFVVHSKQIKFFCENLFYVNILHFNNKKKGETKAEKQRNFKQSIIYSEIEYYNTRHLLVSDGHGLASLGSLAVKLC